MASCYIIKCKCDKIYVGSTLRTPKKRQKEHKTARRRKRYRKQGLIKHNCACGGRWSNSHIRRHQRTKIHRKYVEEEHQKKLIYLQSIENAKKNQEIVTVQKIHYDQDQKKFIKETNVE